MLLEIVLFIKNYILMFGIFSWSI